MSSRVFPCREIHFKVSTLNLVTIPYRNDLIALKMSSWNKWKWRDNDTTSRKMWQNEDKWQRSDYPYRPSDWANEEDDDAFSVDASTSSGRYESALGNKTCTHVYIPGPFFAGIIPQELYDNCSLTSCQNVEKHVRQWREQEAKRHSYCMLIALEKSCGYFIVERIKKHFQKLRELGISFSAEDDHEEDPLNEKILQHIIGVCVECCSFWHVGTPPGFCPNELSWAVYKESIKRVDQEATEKPDRLADEQRSSDRGSRLPCQAVMQNGMKCEGVGHEEQTHTQCLECGKERFDFSIAGLNAHGLSTPEMIKGVDDNWYTLCGRRCQQDHKGSKNFKENDACLKYCDSLGFHADPFTGHQYPDETAMDRNGQGMGLNRAMHIHVGIYDLWRMGPDKADELSLIHI